MIKIVVCIDHDGETRVYSSSPAEVEIFEMVKICDDSTPPSQRSPKLRNLISAARRAVSGLISVDPVKYEYMD